LVLHGIKLQGEVWGWERVYTSQPLQWTLRPPAAVSVLRLPRVATPLNMIVRWPAGVGMRRWRVA
jgi:hypothetical protein